MIRDHASRTEAGLRHVTSSRSVQVGGKPGVKSSLEDESLQHRSTGCCAQSDRVTFARANTERTLDTASYIRALLSLTQHDALTATLLLELELNSFFLLSVDQRLA